jgi:hypothetical protein
MDLASVIEIKCLIRKKNALSLAFSVYVWVYSIETIMRRLNIFLLISADSHVFSCPPLLSCEES